jgi:hypothetical protein
MPMMMKKAQEVRAVVVVVVGKIMTGRKAALSSAQVLRRLILSVEAEIARTVAFDVLEL